VASEPGAHKVPLLLRDADGSLQRGLCFIASTCPLQYVGQGHERIPMPVEEISVLDQIDRSASEMFGLFELATPGEYFGPNSAPQEL
jgi:hypothetical protein